MNPLDKHIPPKNHPLNTSSRNKIEVLTSEKLTADDKEQLYKMYVDTYSIIDDKHYRHDYFMAKFPEHYNVVYVQKEANGEMLNVIVCNAENENGTKICLVFGKNDKPTAEARIEIVKEMLLNQANNMYLEASGPLASILLKDERIPVSLVTEKGDREHYAGIRTKHGKKIMFGYPKTASRTTKNMREFYFYLYEYSKIKLKLGQKSPEEAVNSLKKLFDQVEDSKIPMVYKAILLSKIERKILALNPQGSLEHQAKILDLLSLVSFSDLDQSNILEKKGISQEEQAFLQEMLSEKVDLVKHKHLKG